ncbi:hypothetical protein J6S37_00830, partial [Candidatus Saccharibacteria bacterium]|nr:hypothetical protein [Candidatus Saccharibacteria bacterium]
NSATDIGQNAEGSTLKTTYQTYIRTTQLAGTYTGKVKYTMVHPANAGAPTMPQAATPQCISYWPNASGVADSMGDDCGGSSSGSGYGNNVTVSSLWASNFQRSGYGFAGWTDKFDWILNENDANGNGTGANAGYHIYGPNATITTPSDMTTNGLSLYAVWVPSAGNLQGWTCPDNSTMPIGRVTALKDQRDNDVYAVAKLADGKCWMIENLRLDNDAAHNSDGTLAQGYNSSFIGLADPETAHFTDGTDTTANSLYSTDGSTIAPTIVAVGSYTGSRFPRYNNQNTASPATNMTAWKNNSNTYSVGNWYTWPAAIADASHYSSYLNNQSITATSICPTGWRLPTGGQTTINTTSDYYVFIKTIMDNQEPDRNASTGFGYYSSNLTNLSGKTAAITLRSYPNNFIYSGYFSGSSAFNRGSYSIYWSSTIYGDDRYSNGLYMSANIYPGNSDNSRTLGSSIRCMQ